MLCIHTTCIHSLNNCGYQFLLHARHPSKCWACDSDRGRQGCWLRKRGNNQVNTTMMDSHSVTQELEKTLGWRWKGGTHCRMGEQRRPCGSWRLQPEKRHGKDRGRQRKEVTRRTWVRKSLSWPWEAKGHPRQRDRTWNSCPLTPIHSWSPCYITPYFRLRSHAGGTCPPHFLSMYLFKFIFGRPGSSLLHGISLVVVSMGSSLLLAWASLQWLLVAEYRLQACGPQGSQLVGSAVTAHRL